MKRFPAIMLFAVYAALLGAPAYAQTGGRPGWEESARALLLDYYPVMALGEVFTSGYNNPLKNDGRYAAVLSTETSDFLKVVDISGKTIKEVFDKRYDKGMGKKLNVSFTYGGTHMIVAWPESQGGKDYSNLAIYDLGSRSSDALFSLSLVENLSVEFMDEDLILLIQRWPNLVNSEANIRPVKSQYFVLSPDGAGTGYLLAPHLTKLPGATIDVSARLNNQAVDSYLSGDLKSCRDLLDKVIDMGGAGIAVSRRNLILVSREIEGLEMQKVVSEGSLVTPAYDDARLSFFTGNFQDCINLVRNQGPTTSGERMAMLGYCYAHAEQWADLAAIYSALRGADSALKAEFLSYLVDILDSEGNVSQFFDYMRKLELVDKYHPNLIAHKARLLVRNNREKEAANLLDKYLARFTIPPRYRAKLLLIRWEIGYFRNEQLRMKEIENELGGMPKPDISFLVEMLNFSAEPAREATGGYPIPDMAGRDLEKKLGEVRGG